KPDTLNKFKFSGLVSCNITTPCSHSPISLSIIKMEVKQGLGSSSFARHYSRNRYLLSLPLVTKMFQFTRFPPTTLCIQVEVTRHDSCRVSPFGHLRIKACSQLPEAYRSVPRPSSVIYV